MQPLKGPHFQKFRTNFYLDKKKLITTFNHTYAGGYHFILYGQIISGASIIPQIPYAPKMLGVPEYYTFWTLLDFMRFKNKESSLKLFSNKNEIKRIYSNIPKKKIENSVSNTNNKIQFRTIIIYYCMKILYKSFGDIGRDIKILLPVII